MKKILCFFCIFATTWALAIDPTETPVASSGALKDIKPLDTSIVEEDPTETPALSSEPIEDGKTINSNPVVDNPNEAPAKAEDAFKPDPPERKLDITETPSISSVPLEDINKKKFNPLESHWLFGMSIEGSAYPTPFNFQGDKATYQDVGKKKQTQTIFGPRFFWGGEFYLGKGLMTSTRLEGYFQSTIFKDTKTADPLKPTTTIAEDQTVAQLWGGDLVQTLSYVFEVKVKNHLVDEISYLTIEPFIEAGIGTAKAYNYKKYYWDTSGAVSPDGVSEFYQDRIKEDLINHRFGAGIQLTSRQGFFFHLRVTQNNYHVSSRSETGYYKTTNAPVVNINNSGITDKVHQIMIYSLGGGFKFW
jgi:hypothetical protein